MRGFSNYSMYHVSSNFGIEMDQRDICGKLDTCAADNDE